MAVIYTAHATAIGGRDGHTETDDKKVSFDLSGPGSNGAGTNPEQLFAAGYAACFGGAAQFIAKQHGLDMGKIEVKSSIDLHKDDSGFSLSATMDVQLPGLDRAKAVALVEETHQFCPYSKATRGNIAVTLKVNGETI